VIKVEGLTRRYGSFSAVDDISFRIGRGEIVGLLGHNGAGKTTIMKMLTGFLEPTAGHIEIDGVDIVQQRAVVQRKIGYLPENCPVYTDMSVSEFLEYSAALHELEPEQCRSAIREVMQQTELVPRSTQLIGTLSRGYRQRVGVAQALLAKPEILILDEPTNGLDPSQIQHMRSLIRKVASNATVILSTHILQEVQATCSRVIIVHGGKVALDARLDELRTPTRLLLNTNLELSRHPDLLRDIGAMRRTVALGSSEIGRQYAIEFEEIGLQVMFDKASEIARRIVHHGGQIYSLHPEQRDLETVFAEINASQDDSTGKSVLRETTHV
jgi:ABC-2 type transport system ATP-binding protein